MGVCDRFGIRIIAEGVEVKAEARTLLALGIHLFHGYCFAKPQLDAVPSVDEIS